MLIEGFVLAVIGLFLAGFAAGLYTGNSYGNDRRIYEEFILEEHRRAQQRSSLAGIIALLLIILFATTLLLATE